MNSYNFIIQGAKLKRSFFLLFLLQVLTISCMTDKKDKQDQIKNIEHEFSQMALEKGIKKAFLYYAADDAVLLRNNKLIKGKQEIANYYQNPIWESIKLEWKPDVIEVSEYGDLAYTYGKYVLTEIDSTDNKEVSNGIFHTVWKKQADGSWKYVWD